MKATAIITAAGYSKRMGLFKPLMTIGDVRVIDRCLATFLNAGIKEIIVVTGFNADLITSHLKGTGVKCVYNPQYHHGMFSSVKMGLHQISDDADGFFMLPVDIPLVKVDTIKEMVQLFSFDKGSIVYPSYNQRRGHPPLIAHALIKSILSHDGTDGLKGALRKHESTATYLNVKDPGILMNMNTPQAYEEILSYVKREEAT